MAWDELVIPDSDADDDSDVVFVEERPAPPRRSDSPTATRRHAAAPVPPAARQLRLGQQQPGEDSDDGVELDVARTARRTAHLQRTGKARVAEDAAVKSEHSQHSQPRDCELQALEDRLASSPGLLERLERAAHCAASSSRGPPRELELFRELQRRQLAALAAAHLEDQEQELEQALEHEAQSEQELDDAAAADRQPPDDDDAEAAAATDAEDDGLPPMRAAAAGQRPQQRQQQQRQPPPPPPPPPQQQQQRVRKRALEEGQQPARPPPALRQQQPPHEQQRQHQRQQAAAPQRPPARPAAGGGAAPADAAAAGRSAQEQTQVQRRQLRRKLSAIAQRSRAAQPPERDVARLSNALASALMDVAELAKLATAPREQALAAEVTTNIIHDVRDVVCTYSAASSGRTPAALVRALAEHFAAGGGRLDWARLGAASSHVHRGAAPGTGHLLGPLHAAARARKVAVRSRRAALAEQVRPMEGPDAMAAAHGGDGGGATQETDAVVQAMLRVLRAKAAAAPVPLLQLVLSHDSFSATLENAFALSFLVSQLWVELSEDDADGLLVHLVSKQRHEQLSRNSRQQAPGAGSSSSVVVPHQFMMRLDMQLWEDACAAVPRSSTLMPARLRRSAPAAQP